MAINIARPKGRSLKNLRMVWGFTGRYRGHIAVAALALLVAAAATSGIPYAFKLIIDKGFGSGAAATHNIARWFENLLLLVGVMALATAVRFYFVSWLGERTVADIRLAVHRNLLRLSPGFFEENRPAEITSRLTVDTTIIEQVVGTTVSVALRNAILGVVCIVILVALATKLALLILVGALLVVLPSAVLGRRVRIISTRNQDRIATLGAVTNEVLAAMKIVQAFNQQGREASRFAEAVISVFATAKRRIFVRAIMTAIVIFLIFGAITMVIWQGATQVAAGRMSGGTIAAFVLYGGLLAGAFGNLTEVYGDLLRAAGASERLSELLEAEPDIRAPAVPATLPDPARGEMFFDHVTFHYPARRETSALEDLTLTVHARERLALVGPSGAGKTTIFQLAERFYDPDQGRILLDGVDLRDADPADVRERIAMVPQETVIFAASARDNLRYGNWDASDDQLWEAARDAHAEDFLRALPEGLDTYMGEGGARLSGGQRQRIAIARALLRDAPLLLLDEATSALDAESERLVQDALNRLMRDRTTIVIAHRLATVRAADRIVVMDHGRIVEEGTHASLSGRGGLYARLARLQFEDQAASAFAPPSPPPLGVVPPAEPPRPRRRPRELLPRVFEAPPREGDAALREGFAAPAVEDLALELFARVDLRAPPERLAPELEDFARLAVALRAPLDEYFERPLLAFLVAPLDLPALPPRPEEERDDVEPEPPLPAAASSVHLPDSTRCAASATASAISEPSLVALATTLLAAWVAVSAASSPASRMARRAFGLALIAAAAAARPAASISLLSAALANLSTLSLPPPDEEREPLSEDLAIASSPSVYPEKTL